MRTSRSADSDTGARKIARAEHTEEARFSVKASAATAVGSRGKPDEIFARGYFHGSVPGQAEALNAVEARTRARAMGVPALLASKYPPMDRKQRNLRARSSRNSFARAPRALLLMRSSGIPRWTVNPADRFVPRCALLRPMKRLISDERISGVRHGVESVEEPRGLDEEETVQAIPNRET